MLRHAVSVGSLTLVSRILGFIRDSLVAAVLGTGPVADAFMVAFRLPNLFRRLFTEGAFGAGFVPVFSRIWTTRGADAARGFAGEVLTAATLGGMVITGAAVMFAPQIVAALAPGFLDDPAKVANAVDMTRLALPYLATLTMAGLFAAVLAARHRFAAAAAAPLALNLILIATLVVLHTRGLNHRWGAGLTLAAAVSIAGLVQFLILIGVVWRAGLMPQPRLPRPSQDLGRLVSLGVPAFLAAGVAQLNLLIGTIIASFDAGAMSVLYYADRVFQLPLGVIGIAIGTVLLPTLVSAVQSGARDVVLDTQNRALEMAVALAVPAAAGMVALALPITEVLFERGAFGPHDTERTATALAAFAIGLPAFVLIRVLSQSFLAREDVRTPLWIGLAAIVLNLLLSLVMFEPWREAGLALAATLAGWVNALGLIVALNRGGHWATDHRLDASLRAIGLATLAMMVAVWLLKEIFTPWLGAENPLLLKGSALVMVIAAGLATYIGTCHMLGAIRLGDLWRRLRDKAPPADILPPEA